jgi:hypothetical protein
MQKKWSYCDRNIGLWWGNINGCEPYSLKVRREEEKRKRKKEEKETELAEPTTTI